MKKLILSTLVAAFNWFSTGVSPAVTYYVAPDGEDSHVGITLEQPLRTLQQAARLAEAGDTVLIRAGTYRETIVPAHSGSAHAPITFTAYQNEKVVVSGADLIEAAGWASFSNAIYQIATPVTLNDGNQVFLDGQMMNEARFPNTSLNITRPDKLIAGGGGFTGKGAHAIGTLTNEALVQPPGYWEGATLNVILGKVWVAETMTVTASGPGWLSFAFREGNDYQPAKGNPFFLTGKFSELDAPGEWFYDATAARLYLWAPAGDFPGHHRVEIKARPYAFDLRGRSDIVLRDLHLFAATIITDSHSANLVLDGLAARYLSHFTKLARWKTGATDSGILLDGQHNRLQNSTLAFSAGNGVTLLGSGNIVSNNVIHDVDYSGGVGAGINTGGGCQAAIISHNTVYDVGHRMIDMGNLKGGLIEYNDLSRGGLQITDFGGVYAAATDGQKTRICYNQIHDTDAASCGLSRPNNSKGIYLDNGSSNYIVDHNVVWNTDIGIVLNSREGTRETNRNNLILNNTLAGKRWSYGWKNCNSPQTLVANNIFLNRAEPGQGAQSSHNLFKTINPRFAPHSRFELASNSPARRAGIPCLPYVNWRHGAAPDLGAFAYGVAPWTAGSSLIRSEGLPASNDLALH